MAKPKGEQKRKPGQRGPDQRPRVRRTDGRKGCPAGPGRAPGSEGNILPRNAVGAIKSLRYRVPADAPQVLADVAGEALEQVVKVMQGKYLFAGGTILGAAKMIREEVCGPIAQKVLVAAVSLEDLVKQSYEDEKGE